MKYKYCHEELPEETTLCNFCGKENKMTFIPNPRKSEVPLVVLIVGLGMIFLFPILFLLIFVLSYLRYSKTISVESTPMVPKSILVPEEEEEEEFTEEFQEYLKTFLQEERGKVDVAIVPIMDFPTLIIRYQTDKYHMRFIQYQPEELIETKEYEASDIYYALLEGQFNFYIQDLDSRNFISIPDIFDENRGIEENYFRKNATYTLETVMLDFITLETLEEDFEKLKEKYGYRNMEQEEQILLSIPD